MIEVLALGLESGDPDESPKAAVRSAAHPVGQRLGGLRGALVLVGWTAAIRAAYWVFVTPKYVPQSDAGQYHDLATNLASGRGFSLYFPQLAMHPTAFRPPLYPAVLGFVYWLFGPSIVAGRLLNMTIGVVVVLLAAMVATRLANVRAGLLAGFCVACYPPLIANDVTLLSEPLSLGLLLGLVLALSERRVLLGGALCGLLVLTRPSAQGIALVALLWVLTQVGWRRSLGFLAVTALVVTPWLVRNWIQLGSPILVTSNGFNLAAMYSPEAKAEGHFVDPVFNPAFGDYRLLQFDEVAWQRSLQHLAVGAVTDDPMQVAYVAGRNATHFAELVPKANYPAEVEDGRNITFRSWTLPTFYLVTLAGLWGITTRWRNPTTWLLVALVGYSTITSLVLVAVPRLRAPFDLMCCIGFGIALDALIRHRQSGSPNRRATIDWFTCRSRLGRR